MFNFNKQTSVGKGTIYLTCVSLFSVVVGYILYIFLARLLGPEDFGIYGIVIGLVSVLDRVLLSGVQQTVSKFVSEKERLANMFKNKFLKLIFLFSFFISIIYFLVSKQLALVLNDVTLTKYIQLSALILIFYSLYGVLQGYLNGLRLFKKQAIIRVFYILIKVILVLIFVLLGFGVMGAVVGFILATFVSFVVNWFIVGFKGGGGEFPFKRVIVFSSSIMGFTLVATLLMYIGLFFVKALSPLEVANLYSGYFTAANSIAEIPYFVLMSFSVALFPVVSKLTFENDLKRVRKYILRSVRYSLIILIFITVVISSTSNEIISLLYSSKYIFGAQTLSILVFGLAFYALFIMLTTIISGSGKPSYSILFSLIILVLTVILNYLLIPSYSLVGAALAITVATLIGCIVSAIYIKKRFKVLLNLSSFVKIILTGIIIYLFSNLFIFSSFLLILKYIILGVFYLIILIILKQITKKDFILFKNSLF